jgi:hypothetical protein
MQELIIAVTPRFPSSSRSTSLASSQTPLQPGDSTATINNTDQINNSILIFVWALEMDPSFAGKGSARSGKKGAVPVSIADPLNSTSPTSIPVLSLDSDIDRRDQPTNEYAEVKLDIGIAENLVEHDRRIKLTKDQDVFVPWALQKPQIPKSKAPQQSRIDLIASHSDTPGNSAPTERASRRGPKSKQEWDKIQAELKIIGDSVVDSSPTTSLTAESPLGYREDITRKNNSDGRTIIEVDGTIKPNFNRYYHLFRHYELSQLVEAAANELGAIYLPPTIKSTSERLIQSAEEREIPKTREERVEDDGKRRLVVELLEEVWERENWVVKIEVYWSR